MESRLLDSRYRFIKILGANELGQTYLVADTQSPGYPNCVIRRLKIPKKNPRTLKFVLILLKKKAEALQKLGKHDQIPQILSFFEEDSSFYLVEEFIPGQPLSEELIPGQPWPEVQVLSLLQAVLEILAVVHQWGVIHRCIKPSNLIRRQSDGKIVLTGFGIFREISTQVLRSPAPSSTSAEQNGAAVYQPSEQFQGQLQFNTDLYAVGMLGIQALTGLSTTDLSQLQRSNGASAHRLDWRHRAEISPALAEILDRMIHPNSQQRYQQTAQVLEDLQKIRLENAWAESTAPPPPVPTAPPSSPRRPLFAINRGWLVSCAVLVAVLGLGAAWYARLPQNLLAGYLSSRGASQGDRGNAEQAIASYTQAIQLKPSGDAYYRRGLLHYQQGNYQPALEDLTQAIRLSPNQSRAYYYRGNIRATLGDRQEALADYTEAIRLNPQLTDAYINRGTVQADLGEEQNAIHDYTQAIQLDPTSTAAYLNRCLSRSNVEDHRGAIDDCNHAIDLQPNSVLAYQNRGLARRRLGDLQGAIADFNIAIRLDPTDPDPYYNRGLAREELGDRQGAIADYTAAIEQNSSHIFAHYDRGMLRRESGDIAGAIADFRESAKLCLDAGSTGCYDDAQYQIEQLERP